MSRWQQISGAEAVLERELGTIYKDPGGKLRVALAYPNTYFVGMSSLALHILYRAFNARPDVACERVFWDPAVAGSGEPLIALESQADVAGFDVWAFTVSFEMDYFNIVAMLAQAGVPLLAEERRSAAAVPAARHGAAALGEARWPLLVAGGPAVTMNPEVLAPFFDVIVIGEGEEVLGPLTDALAAGINEDRDQLLAALSRIPGVYIPSLSPADRTAEPIARLWVKDLAGFDCTSVMQTPDTEFAHLHLVEIARGCGRGCRYCLAGYLYRPPREQPAERILAWARAALARGHDKIGLVAAAVSDHSQIDDLATELQAMGARISVSSMRTDPLSVPLVQALAASGTQTLTIAPEAGSERLRRAINKPQSEENLLAAVELAQALKFPHLKMYFMIGHPTETDEDIEGIVDLTLKAKRLFRRNISINATPFVPKAHTPFEREGFTPAKTLADRQNRLKRNLARHNIVVKSDSPQWAEVQAVLSRGDRRLAPVLADLVGPALSGSLTVRGFHDALADRGLTAAEFSGERPSGAALPWHVVQTGVSEKYLAFELRRAGQEQTGHSCLPTTSGCRTCGVCC